MRRIGIYGGTFDPIHIGHLNLCRAMKEKLSLDEIIMIPTGTPPHKAATATNAEYRLEMCRLAVRDFDLTAKVSDIEIRREGRSYTYLTVMQLLEEDKERELYLAMGADMFMSLESWYNFAELKKLVTFCAVQRDDVSTDELEKEAERLHSIGCRCVIISLPAINASSTEVRNRTASGKPIDDLVTASVAEFIRKKGLYKQEVK